MEQNINLSELSSSELEKLLTEKRKEEARKRQEAKKRYENERDEMIVQLLASAGQLNLLLREFKTEVFGKIEQFKELAAKYGDVRKNSKGGFSIRTNDSKYKISYKRNKVNEFDERADMSLDLIKEFLESTVKKRDQSSYKIISKILARNKAGDLNVDRVLNLLDLRNDFNDQRWQKAMQLLEESYRDRPISFSIEFSVRNEKTGKDEPLSLNFTAVDLISNNENL